MFSKGTHVQSQSKCTLVPCYHFHIALGGGFEPDPRSIECWSSRDPTAAWYSGTWQWPTSGLWSEGGCWFGYPGEQVWVVVDGVKSNVVVW